MRALDDGGTSIAEIWRQVGAAAEQLGLTRPSYVHVRRLVVAERERREVIREQREAMREIAADVAIDLIVGRTVNAYDIAGRVHDVRERTQRQ